ncbi:MAG: hypothetical protein PHR51_01375 [Patescibacteria group bacterium]|nr:hypothetical protein [Patescibacteria group bacterium]
MRSRLVILGLALAAAAIALSGCISGLQAASLEPTEVMTNFSLELERLSGFSYDLTLELSGNLPTGLGQNVEAATLRLTGLMDGTDSAKPNIKASGQITTEVEGLPVTLGGQLISVDDYTYFKIDALQLPLFLSSDIGQLGRWYKVKHPAIETAGQVLGTAPSQALTLSNAESFDPNLFEIVEALPDETIGALRSYHYRVHVKTAVLSSLLAQLTDTVLLPDDVLDQLSNYVVDIWIGKRDFWPTRLVFRGVYSSQGIPLGVDLDIALSNHNHVPTIKAPVVQQFDPYGSLLNELPMTF